LPHCIIEYSQELAQEVDVNLLMKATFQGAEQSALFTANDIKVRAIAYDHFYSEIIEKLNNSQQRFIHVCCKILSGRTLEQKNNLSKTILSALTCLNINSVSISVEIFDIERESYNKLIS